MNFTGQYATALALSFSSRLLKNCFVDGTYQSRAEHNSVSKLVSLVLFHGLLALIRMATWNSEDHAHVAATPRPVFVVRLHLAAAKRSLGTKPEIKPLQQNRAADGASRRCNTRPNGTVLAFQFSLQGDEMLNRRRIRTAQLGQRPTTGVPV